MGSAYKRQGPINNNNVLNADPRNALLNRTRGPLSDPNNNMNNVQSPLKCQCEISTRQVEWKCFNCNNKVFCRECKAVHDSIPSCKAHFVKTISQAAQEIKSGIQQQMCLLGNHEQLTDEHLEGFFKYRNQMERSTKEAVRSINEHEEFCIQTIKEQHQAFRDGVHGAKQKLKEQLDEKENYLQDILGKIKRIKQELVKIDATEDSNQVVYLDQEKGKKIQAFCKSLEDTVPSEIIPPYLQVHIDRKNHIDINQHLSVKPEVKLLQIKYKNQDETEGNVEAEMTVNNNNITEGIETLTLNSMMVNYSEILKYVYKLDKSFLLQYSPRRLKIIDDQIWCVGTAAIYIYNKDGSLSKHISHDALKKMKSITQTQSGHIIVACWDGKGLLQLDQAGGFQEHLLQGRSFSDVASQGQFLYALSYEDSTVQVMKLVSDGESGQRWRHEREIRLGYNNGNNLDSLYVHTNTIHVCSWENHCIYHFNHMGQVCDIIYSLKKIYNFVGN